MVKKAAPGNSAPKTSNAKPNEIALTRLYDAPVKAVWEAWTDPAQITQWWGPRGFTHTTHRKELRTGGIWEYTMHGPDGVDYPNRTRYLEVIPERRMVYDHGGNDEREAMFRVTVNFVPVGQQTRMEMTMALKTAEEARAAREFIKQAGGNATWDRLAEHVGKVQDGRERFVVNRSFDASVETLFEMWADPAHLSRWLAPTGSTMEFLRADVRVGATSFYRMSGAGSPELYGKIQYLEIQKPHLLKYTQQFCDKNEEPGRHPMLPEFPSTMLTTVQFAAEDDGQSRVTVTWETFGEISSAELMAFVNLRAGMTQGWSGSFDKLEEYLAESLPESAGESAGKLNKA